MDLMREDRWDEEYEHGAHWETQPSSQTKVITKNVAKGSMILDAGCGSGRDSIWFAQQSYTVYGIDISPVGIEKAKSHAQQNNVTVHFQVGNVEELPYEDNMFDAVYTGYVLQRADLKKTIPEFARVLKPNGLLHISMFEKTEYDTDVQTHPPIDHAFIIETISEHFMIRKQSLDSYSEVDQWGPHKHVRLILTARKK